MEHVLYGGPVRGIIHENQFDVATAYADNVWQQELGSVPVAIVTRVDGTTEVHVMKGTTRMQLAHAITALVGLLATCTVDA